MSDINTLDSKENSTDSLMVAALVELDELISRAQFQSLKNKDLNYLLTLWARFSIYQVEPLVLDFEVGSGEDGSRTHEVSPHVVRLKGGWKVLDYGDGLITSRGGDYGSYGTGALLNTVKYMVACLAERGVTSVVFSGTLPAKRLAWIECARYGITHRFSPDRRDIKFQESLKRYLAGNFKAFKL